MRCVDEIATVATWTAVRADGIRAANRGETGQHRPSSSCDRHAGCTSAQRPAVGCGGQWPVAAIDVAADATADDSLHQGGSVAMSPVSRGISFHESLFYSLHRLVDAAVICLARAARDRAHRRRGPARGADHRGGHDPGVSRRGRAERPVPQLARHAAASRNCLRAVDLGLCGAGAARRRPGDAVQRRHSRTHRN